MTTPQKIDKDLHLIRVQSPLVHNITNFVVMNNTANALLSIGASPVMAHATDEVEQIASIADALVLNIGTLTPEWVDAMILAGKAARRNKRPTIFDPVGAGASELRNQAAAKIISQTHPTIIRGNGSEIMTLAKNAGTTKGVDSTVASLDALDAARKLATQTRAIVVISGPEDYITDGNQVLTVRNGSPLMSRVTGMGCTATAIIGAFAAINPNPIEAAYHAMCLMSIAGERAAAYSRGNGSMQLNFLDELYSLTLPCLEETYRP